MGRRRTKKEINKERKKEMKLRLEEE